MSYAERLDLEQHVVELEKCAQCAVNAQAFRLKPVRCSACGGYVVHVCSVCGAIERSPIPIAVARNKACPVCHGRPTGHMMTVRLKDVTVNNCNAFMTVPTGVHVIADGVDLRGTPNGFIQTGGILEADNIDDDWDLE